MTWNFNSWVFVRALRSAHKRGVSVRILMARKLAQEQGRGGPYNTLRRALQQAGPPARDAQLVPHLLPLLPRQGRRDALEDVPVQQDRCPAARRHVVLGQHDRGVRLARSTTTCSPSSARSAPTSSSIKMFNEASRDRPAAARVYAAGDIRGWFQPRPGLRDLVSKMLDRVKCQGARGAGINGRTSLRIAQDVIHGQPRDQDRAARSRSSTGKAATSGSSTASSAATCGASSRASRATTWSATPTATAPTTSTCT